MRKWLQEQRGRTITCGRIRLLRAEVELRGQNTMRRKTQVEYRIMMNGHVLEKKNNIIYWKKCKQQKNQRQAKIKLQLWKKNYALTCSYS